MDKLKMMSMDKVSENIEKIKALFPNCVTEVKRGEEVEYAIDFDVLKQELSKDLVDEREERYQMTWPDKKKSVVLANSPINKTLRPCREESVDFDNTENLYIEGDNLEVLKLLQETYLGKIDVIYIDPPYNTGKDVIYKNDYEIKEDEFGEKYDTDEEGNRLYINSESNGRFHTDWMNMMYSRIRLARDLIKDEGFLLVAIDHNELFNLGEICDEIFGFENRVGIISVVHKPEGRNQAKFIGPSNEFMLIYAKNENIAKLQKVALDDEQIQSFNCTDEKGAYRLKNFIRLADGKYATKESKPNFWYPIYVSKDLVKMDVSEFDNSTAVYPVTIQGVERTWKTTKETFLDRYQQGEIVALSENGRVQIFEKLREDQVIKTHWINRKYHGYHFGTKILDELLGVKTFDFPKSLYLMKDICKLFVPKSGMVLDFFSGSATTAHAVMLLNSEDGGNRKYIMAQIPASCDEKSEAYKAGYKNICEIGKERIRRAGKKIKEESPLTTQNLDTGFRVLKLDSSNMLDVYYNPDKIEQTSIFDYKDNIKADRSAEDLLFQIMLDMGVTLSAKIEEKEINGTNVFAVDGDFLVACFADNLTDDTLIEIAKLKPRYAAFRDSSFANDSVAKNCEQIFATYSPNTKCTVV